MPRSLLSPGHADLRYRSLPETNVVARWLGRRTFFTAKSFAGQQPSVQENTHSDPRKIEDVEILLQNRNAADTYKRPADDSDLAAAESKI
jgi:hypothetical protein